MIIPTLLIQMKKQLSQMNAWLDLAVEHAKARSFEPNVYLSLRLAPDQFTFARQVQVACDMAKFAAARTAGKDAPSHPDNEQTIDELRARVADTVKFLDGFTAKDFEGAEARPVSLPRWEGKVMPAPAYFVEHALPNFYFHLTTAYAILRHAGVNVGKRDYLGTLTLRDR